MIPTVGADVPSVGIIVFTMGIRKNPFNPLCLVI